MVRQLFSLATGAAFFCALTSTAVLASSHREAPFIAQMPSVDGTDFYMFRSYEQGREDTVTLIANYQPLQDAYGGPNYFTMNPKALYEIHIDNTGDSRENLTFQFRFETTYRNATVDVDGTDVPIALTNVGPGSDASNVGPGIDANAGLNVIENYRVSVVQGDRRTGARTFATNPQPLTGDDSSQLFRKPVDNIGEKTIPDYETYADSHVFDIDLSSAIPGCTTNGRVFVGQRREGFVVNLGEVFDRINLDPLGARDSGTNIVNDKNITSLALEVPTSCLTEQVTTADGTAEPVIGGWTTASLRQARALNPLPNSLGSAVDSDGDGTDDNVIASDGDLSTPSVEGGPWTQVSRLGSPLVNEVVIGLPVKDRFNATEPVNDLGLYGVFVVSPTLPVLVDALFDVPPPATPRNDLVAAFVTGIAGLTQPQFITDGNTDINENGVIEPSELRTGGEMLRLNTAVPADPPPQLAGQNDLGFLGCDLYGFPNGRRPIDDVVDIELTVLEGAIRGDDPDDDDPETEETDESNPNSLQTCDLSGDSPQVVNEGAVVNDGALPDPDLYSNEFPYLTTPLPGSPVAASQP